MSAGLLILLCQFGLLTQLQASTTPALTTASIKSGPSVLHNAYGVHCEEASPLLILVESTPTIEGARRRANVRRTWASRRGTPVVFYFAISDSESNNESGSLQAGVDSEAKRYGDVVQFHLLQYQHRAIQLAILRWAAINDRCPKVPYLVHVNDFVFVDIVHVTEYLAAHPPVGFLCKVRRPVNRRRRGLESCETAAYALSSDSARRLLDRAKSVKRDYSIDYVTGPLRQAARLPLTEFPRGHAHGQLLPSDARNAQGTASDYMFLSSERPEFHGLYWDGVWRNLLIRENARYIV